MLMKRLSSVSVLYRRAPKAGYCALSAASTAPTVAPSPLMSDWLSTCGRRAAGMVTLGMGFSGNRAEDGKSGGVCYGRRGFRHLVEGGHLGLDRFDVREAAVHRLDGLEAVAGDADADRLVLG